MIFKLIFGYCCLLSFFDCFALPYELPSQVKMVEDIRKKAMERLAKKHHLYPVGFGSSMPDGVKEISLSFEIDRALSKNEARMIIIDCVQDLLSDVNRNKKLRPYLKVYPFDANNIEIEIYIGTPENKILYHPNIAVTAARNGKIKYATNDPVNEWLYKSEEFETFEEALKIVEEQKSAELAIEQKCKNS